MIQFFLYNIIISIFFSFRHELLILQPGSRSAWPLVEPGQVRGRRPHAAKEVGRGSRIQPSPGSRNQAVHFVRWPSRIPWHSQDWPLQARSLSLLNHIYLTRDRHVEMFCLGHTRFFIFLWFKDLFLFSKSSLKEVFLWICFVSIVVNKKLFGNSVFCSFR